MTKPYIPFTAFLLLFLLTRPLSFDFATSVVPGWHTTIFPPYFVWGLIVTIILLFVVIGYWLLIRRQDKVNWTLFTLHFLLTAPPIVIIHFPTFLLNADLKNQEEFVKAVIYRTQFFSVAWVLFFAGQMLFLIYFIRASKNARLNTKEV